MNDQGQKLSKQNLAQALDLSKAPELLQKRYSPWDNPTLI